MMSAVRPRRNHRKGASRETGVRVDPLALPCPFCGEWRGLCATTFGDGDSGVYQCPRCDATGPSVSIDWRPAPRAGLILNAPEAWENRAMTMWNQRAHMAAGGKPKKPKRLSRIRRTLCVSRCCIRLWALCTYLRIVTKRLGGTQGRRQTDD